MSALHRCFLSASQQFMSVAKPAILNARSQNLVAAVLIAIAAVSTFSAPTNANAQVWAGGVGGTTSQQGSNSPLPQSSAGRYGELMGGVLGRAAGGVVAGNSSNSDIGRRTQAVVTGIGEEVGRNLGRAGAEKPYEPPGNHIKGRPGGPDYSNGATSNSSKLTPATPVYERDHLDKLGLRAIFANSEAIKAGDAYRGGSSVPMREATDFYNQSLRNFEMALRATADRGFDIQPWMDARQALQQPLRAVPEQRMAELGSTMYSNLSRPGGPGYSDRDTSNVITLESLRILTQKNQQLASSGGGPSSKLMPY